MDHTIRFIGWALLLNAVGTVYAEAPHRASAVFDQYVQKVEARLASQHSSPTSFLASAYTRARDGGLVIDDITPDLDPPGAMLHHWRGTAFAPGATPANFEQLMKNFGDYPRIYAPQVLSATILSHTADHYAVKMRVVQKHVLTVVLDTSYDVTFGRLDPRHGYSISRSTQIYEIDAPGTRNERVLSSVDEHGFLWRLNTYWTYEERDGGLYLQIETVSLTRSIPTGLGWAIRPFVETVPRDSLEFTLRKTCEALKSTTTRFSAGNERPQQQGR